MRNKKPDLQPFDWAKHMLKRETDKRAWQALNVQLKILEFTRPLGAKVTCTKQCLLKLAQMRGIIINGVDWDGDWRGMAGGTQECCSSVLVLNVPSLQPLVPPVLRRFLKA